MEVTRVAGIGMFVRLTLPLPEESDVVRQHLEVACRRILEAAQRGLTETTIATRESPAESELLRCALDARGFKMTTVGGEDGEYSVVHW